VRVQGQESLLDIVEETIEEVERKEKKMLQMQERMQSLQEDIYDLGDKAQADLDWVLNHILDEVSGPEEAEEIEDLLANSKSTGSEELLEHLKGIPVWRELTE